MDIAAQAVLASNGKGPGALSVLMRAA